MCVYVCVCVCVFACVCAFVRACMCVCLDGGGKDGFSFLSIYILFCFISSCLFCKALCVTLVCMKSAI